MLIVEAGGASASAGVPINAHALAVEAQAEIHGLASLQPDSLGPHFQVIPYSGSAVTAQADSGLPTWTGTADYPAGNSFSYTMVGANPFSPPSNPSVSIPAPVIGLRLNFTGGSSTDATTVDSACGQSQSAVNLALNSPLFQNDVSGTQFVDAFQRANFYAETSSEPNYHLLLDGTNAGPALTIDVPSGFGATTPAGCSPEGGLFGDGSTTNGVSWLDQQITDQISSGSLASYGVTPGSVPVFLLYNTVMCGDPACDGIALGYHSAFASSSGTQTYVVADYQTNAGVPPAPDTEPLSHELGEWADDPFGTNAVPTWGYIGQDLFPDKTGTCQQNLEAADPLTGTLATIDGYHVQDLAFTSWFYRQSPSTAQDGAYSLFPVIGGATNLSEPSDATVCPAQPIDVTASPGDGQATISWTQQSASSPVDQYAICPVDTNGIDCASSLFTTSTKTSATVTGLADNTTYQFVVLAGRQTGTDPAGNPILDVSTPSATVSVTPKATTSTSSTTTTSTTSPPPATAGGGSTQSNGETIPASTLAFTGPGKGTKGLAIAGMALAALGAALLLAEHRRRLRRLAILNPGSWRILNAVSDGATSARSRIRPSEWGRVIADATTDIEGGVQRGVRKATGWLLGR
jgi:hypothetical protein